jgi:MFS family permease
MDRAVASQTPLQWITRDGWLLIAARFLLSFGQGFISVLLGIYLALQGLDTVFIGLFLTLGLAGAAGFTFLVGLVGDAMGRRRLMFYFALASGAVGLALLVTDNVALLMLLAFLGSFSIGGPAGDTIQPLEQASLPQTCAPERRTDLFAITAVARQVGTALGALAAGLPALYQSSLGLSEVGAYKVMVLGYIFCMVLPGLLYIVLSPAVEVASPQRWTNPLRLPSRGIIFKLSALFAVDNFASGLTIQSLVSYWFFTRFDLQLSSVAFIFFVSNTINAISFWVAARLAHRIGLLNTMVFTHIPASLLLIALPFVPSAWLAVTLWQVRSFFNQMDAPTRQSYTMAVVPENERTAMSVYNSISRTSSMSASPTIAGALWNVGSASVPFVACGVLKIFYDLALFVMFRKLKPEEEMAKETRK